MQPRSVLKNKRTTFERIEKFISPVYFTDCNLFGRLHVKSCNLKSLKTFASEAIITYEEAIKQKFSDVAVGKSFGPTWSTHWFKLEIEIPYGWAGREVRLVWDSESEALIWRDGQPIQGLSSQLKRIYYVLTKKFDPIKESGLTLYIEMACNDIFGAGDGGFIKPPKVDKYFKLKRAEVVLFDNRVHDLLLDFEVLVDMIKSLPEESHRLYNALYLANDMINIITEGGGDSYAEAHKMAMKLFNEKNGASQFNLFAIGHCHIDTAWLWPYRETRRKCARSFSSVLQLMDEFPDFVFACSQAQQYEWVKEYYPLLFDRIKVKVKEGKFLPVGGTWIEMDCNIPSGESLVRQFLIGHKFFKREFNIKCTEFWLPDTFGYPGQLPQIMKLCGMERFITQKMSWSLVNKFPHHTFWWYGIDDSKVLTHFPPGDSYNMTCEPSELLKSSKNFQDKGRSDCSLFVFGFGDGGQGPTEDMLHKLERIKDIDGLPRVTCSNLDKFFSRVEEQDSKNGMLCNWKGELFLELHNATYTTHALVKKGNRVCEVLLRAVELLASLKSAVHGRLKGDVEHKEIERLWKLLLLDQFHDVLPGTSINMVYKDVFDHYKDILKSGSNLIVKLSEELFGKNEAGDGNFTIFNTLSWSRQECFEISKEKLEILEHLNVASQRLKHGNYLVLVNVPSVGYSRIGSNELSPYENCSVEEIEGKRIFMTNGLVRAVFDDVGHLLELYVAEETRNAIRSGCRGNQLLLFDDVPLYWDAWDVMDYHLETMQLQNNASSKIEIIESGPLRVALEVSHEIGKNSSLKQIITLDVCSPCIRFYNQVRWFESHKFLKVEFSLNVSSRRATHEIQFGHMERSTHCNTSWDSAQFEVCGHKWADCSEYDFGVAVLNDSKYGWSCIDNNLRLSLLRSSKCPDETADMGSHEFTYAIMPHRGSFQSAGVIRSSYNLNNPLLLLNDADSLSSKSFVAIGNPSVILEAFKMSEEEDNKCIARFYEAFGGTTTTEVTFNFEVKDIKWCNLLEEESHEISIKNKKETENTIELTFRPFQIITISIKFL